MTQERIDAHWLDTHTWMLRSSDDGRACGGFRWSELGEWTECPDWSPRPVCGGGLHGETPEHNGFGLMYKRIDLCEIDGKAVCVDGDKIKVPRARIVASGSDIPCEAFIRCGYRIAKGEIPVIDSGRWIVNGSARIGRVEDGYVRSYGSSTMTIKTVEGGYVRSCGSSTMTIETVEDGYVRSWGGALWIVRIAMRGRKGGA